MRDTGVIRKDLSDEGAAPYIGQARTLLGILQNQMGFNQLAQGTLSRTLPDGTEIKVSSIYGQRKVSITVPAAATTPEAEQVYETPVVLPDEPQPTPIETYDTSLGSLVIAGACHESSPTTVHAVIWNAHGVITHDLVLPGEQLHPTGLSLDGRVMVGWRKYPNGDVAPWRWTAAQGLVMLGSLGAVVQTYANGVSGDGSIVVGYAQAVGGVDRAWRWDAKNGFALLPTTGGYTSHATAISPNGKYIVGIDNGDGAVWTEGGTVITIIPRPGTETPHTAVMGPASFTWNPDISTPADVTDAGVVCGTTGHRGWVGLPSSTISTYYPDHLGHGGGTQYSNDIQYINDTRVPVPSFTYNVVSGSYTIDATGGAPAASASRTRDTTVGLTTVSTQITNHTIAYNGWFTNDPADYSSFLQAYRYANETDDTTAEVLVNNPDQGWISANGKQTFLGDWTQPHDVSEDGRVVVGAHYEGAGNTHFPCMWANLVRRDLQLPPGTVSGDATVVSTAAPPAITVGSETV